MPAKLAFFYMYLLLLQRLQSEMNKHQITYCCTQHSKESQDHTREALPANA